MASRKIEDLAVEFQKPCLDLIHECKLIQIDLLVYCTYRSVAEQAKEYAKGRTMPGHIVTHARAGESPHNCTINGKPAARAFDAVPIVNGRAVWSLTAEDLQRWAIIGNLARQLGIFWGGNWAGPKQDRPHFQQINWKELNDANN